MKKITLLLFLAVLILLGSFNSSYALFHEKLPQKDGGSGVDYEKLAKDFLDKFLKDIPEGSEREKMKKAIEEALPRIIDALKKGSEIAKKVGDSRVVKYIKVGGGYVFIVLDVATEPFFGFIDALEFGGGEGGYLDLVSDTTFFTIRGVAEDVSLGVLDAMEVAFTIGYLTRDMWNDPRIKSKTDVIERYEQIWRQLIANINAYEKYKEMVENCRAAGQQVCYLPSGIKGKPVVIREKDYDAYIEQLDKQIEEWEKQKRELGSYYVKILRDLNKEISVAMGGPKKDVQPFIFTGPKEQIIHITAERFKEWQAEQASDRLDKQMEEIRKRKKEGISEEERTKLLEEAYGAEGQKEEIKKELENRLKKIQEEREELEKKLREEQKRLMEGKK